MVEGSPGKTVTHRNALAHPFQPEQGKDVCRGMRHLNLKQVGEVPFFQI